jgi:hypothetical protein
MSAPRYAALAGKLLRRAQRDAVSSPLPADRADAIAAIGQALEKRQRLRRFLQWAWVADVALLVGLSASWYAVHRAESPVAPPPDRLAAAPTIKVVGHPAGGGATVEDTGSPSPLTDGRSLGAGSRIVARPDGRVVLSLSTGTNMTVEEGGDLTIVDNGPNQVFDIRAGAVRAHVAKLEVGQRLVLRTPDAEVEVRGTSFRVAIADADPSCGGGTTTRVAAFEGVVSVRHGAVESRIGAGQTWPSDCIAARALLPRPRPSRRVVSNAPSREAAPESARADESSQALSDLAEQNDSFAHALAKKQRGAAREAVAAFEVFAVRYPSSPLCESAFVERMRLLTKFDRPAAELAARQYLARYPAGFARSEAESIDRASR